MDLKTYSEDIDLSKYWLTLKRRWFVASSVFGLSVIAATIATALQEPVYEAQAKLLFQSDQSSSLTGLESQNKRGELDSVSAKSEPLTTQAEIIKSPAVAQATIDALDIRTEDGEPISPGKITSELSVRPVPGSDVLQLSYRSPDPILAAAVVNGLIEVYREKNVLMNRAATAAAREFILAELPGTEQAVSQAEAELRQFKEANNIVVLQEEATATVSRLSTLEQTITQVKSQLADITQKASTLRDRVGMDSEVAVAMSALSQSQGVQEALLQLQQVQGELAVQRTRYRAEHPEVAGLQRQEASLIALLRERVQEMLGSNQSVSLDNLQLGELEQGLISDLVQTEVERLGLTQRLEQLQAAQRESQARSQSLPRLEETQRELERQLNAAQQTYETLLAQLQEVQVAENQTIGNAQVISAATAPGSPVAPSKKINMAAGIIAGLLMAIAAAFLRDLADGSVKTIRAAQVLYDQPVLGVIPAFRSPSPVVDRPNRDRIVVLAAPQSPLSSAYQMLQANLEFANPDGVIRAVAVSSAVAGEGKSEVVANLAAAAALRGQRVLLVDANFHQPMQHHFWELNNTTGLSNVIVRQSSFHQAVQTTVPNLDVLTAGVTPPNTLALLGSKGMAHLVESCRHRYDYDLILFDTPALLGAADTLTLSKLTDGLLMVVRPGEATQAQATQAKDFLERSRQTVLGLVANHVLVAEEPDSYYYFQDGDRIAEPPVEVVPAAVTTGATTGVTTGA